MRKITNNKNWCKGTSVRENKMTEVSLGKTEITLGV